MKIPICMIVGLLISIFILDITSIYMVRSKLIQSADIASDAALIGGLSEYDAKNGRSFIDEHKGYELADNYFRRNMKLDMNLENEYIKNTEFHVEFYQDGLKPKVTIHIKSVIKALAPKVVGLDGIPINIRKTRYYISNYK